MDILNPQTPRFKGITMKGVYEDVLEDSLKEGLKKPEDKDVPKIQNQIDGSFNG